MGRDAGAALTALRLLKYINIYVYTCYICIHVYIGHIFSLQVNMELRTTWHQWPSSADEAFADLFSASSMLLNWILGRWIPPAQPWVLCVLLILLLCRVDLVSFHFKIKIALLCSSDSSQQCQSATVCTPNEAHRSHSAVYLPLFHDSFHFSSFPFPSMHRRSQRTMWAL